MSQGDLAFLVRAVDVQMQQYADSYLEDDWAVRGYATLDGLPGDQIAAMSILDEVDEPGALGYHDSNVGIPFGRCKVSKDPTDGTTLSHECLELRADPFCNLWLPLPDGRKIAREICDPVQNDSYIVKVTIGSETRNIWVSDFVLPAYFVPGSQGPYSFCDNVDEPFGVSKNGGGWRLVRDERGNITSEYGTIGVTPELLEAMRKRANDPGSRTNRRGYR